MQLARKRKNAYRCGLCGKNTITSERDPGTIAFLITCRATPGCLGEALSLFYALTPDLQDQPATCEWYMPQGLEKRGLTKEQRAHCLEGGLLLRDLKQPAIGELTSL